QELDHAAARRPAADRKYGFDIRRRQHSRHLRDYDGRIPGLHVECFRDSVPAVALLRPRASPREVPVSQDVARLDTRPRRSEDVGGGMGRRTPRGCRELVDARNGGSGAHSRGRGKYLGRPEVAALMAETPGNTATTSAEFGARPRDDELDLFGITHVGKVRIENQDHFLVATVHPELIIHETSLPAPQSLPIHGTRLATVMLVADGVGGSTGGREASQLAIETIMRYVSSSLRCYHAARSSEAEEFI